MKLCKQTSHPLLSVLVILALAGCERKIIVPDGPEADAQGHTRPTPMTAAANAAWLESLPFQDRQDFEDASRGLIASLPALIVRDPEGHVIWDRPAYDFIVGEAPASVHPSLWRQEQLNNIHGLFKVTEGIYQLRGFDLSNMTLIKGDDGWIVVDPLTARETAAEALRFARKHLGDMPVTAIVFTHSHVDHFGGALGVLDVAQPEPWALRVFAPEGFMAEATSENLIAGTAMGRRAMFMYGKRLARSERGHIGSGLGKGPAFGHIGILEPTDIITHTPEPLTIDGVRFVFQNAPHSEAPAELTFYLPDQKAFCGAELTSHNLHNLYTLRGAKVRDALAWSAYIEQSRALFGDAEIYFASHHWPIWGKANIRRFLEEQGDTYKYIHDQSVRLFNEGLTPGEVAEELMLPESLRRGFHNRDYYGTLKHNARAVYQNYLGWYDGNPANLDPLPPELAATRYVTMMGGGSAVLESAQTAFDDGEYRWAAQILNHLMFARPDNSAARALLARCYDQLGYRSESGPWRDEYLSAAYELRHGPPEQGIDISIMADLLSKVDIARFFDTLAVRLNGPRADGLALSVRISFTDLRESYLLTIRNAVLHHRRADDSDRPDASLALTHELFIKMMIGQAGLKETLFSDDLDVQGSVLDLVRFFSLFEKPDGTYDIVTP